MDSFYNLGSSIYYGVLNLWWDTNYHMYTWRRWIVDLASASFREEIPSIEDTIANLQNVREEVVKRESQLQQQMEKHKENAKMFAQDKRLREAKVQIKLRMLYDNQIVNTQRILTAIESHLVAIQSASLNKQVFLVLHNSSKALGMGTDEDQAEDVLDKLDEQHSQTKNIIDLLSTQESSFDLDDDAVEQELKQLMEPEVSHDEHDDGHPVDHLPTVPTSRISPNNNTTSTLVMEE